MFTNQESSNKAQFTSERVGAIGQSLMYIIALGAQREGLKAEKREAESAAQQIELETISREADRKERLAKALASQNARAGAGGIQAFAGSPLTIMQEDIRKEKISSERARFSADLEKLTTANRAKMNKATFDDMLPIGIAGSLLKGIS